MGLVLYAVSAREPGAAPTAFDRLQLLLVVSALLVDALALAAIAARITELGFTPNRVFTLAHDRGARAVDHEMQAGTCGGATQRKIEMLATP